MWRGSPLPEFPDEPFRGCAVRLIDVRRAALVRHTEALLRDGRVDEAVAALSAEVDADLCWEPGVLALAQALDAADRRADAAGRCAGTPMPWWIGSGWIRRRR